LDNNPQGLIAYATEAQSRHHWQPVVTTGAPTPGDIQRVTGVSSTPVSLCRRKRTRI